MIFRETGIIEYIAVSSIDTMQVQEKACIEVVEEYSEGLMKKIDIWADKSLAQLKEINEKAERIDKAQTDLRKTILNEFVQFELSIDDLATDPISDEKTNFATNIQRKIHIELPHHNLKPQIIKEMTKGNQFIFDTPKSDYNSNQTLDEYFRNPNDDNDD